MHGPGEGFLAWILQQKLYHTPNPPSRLPCSSWRNYWLPSHHRHRMGHTHKEMPGAATTQAAGGGSGGGGGGGGGQSLLLTRRSERATDWGKSPPCSVHNFSAAAAAEAAMMIFIPCPPSFPLSTSCSDSDSASKNNLNLLATRGHGMHRRSVRVWSLDKLCSLHYSGSYL